MANLTMIPGAPITLINHNFPRDAGLHENSRNTNAFQVPIRHAFGSEWLAAEQLLPLVYDELRKLAEAISLPLPQKRCDGLSWIEHTEMRPPASR